MATGIVDVMKQAAIDAIEAAKPVTIVFGTVTKINPIEISVSPSLTLTESVLTLSRNVTDYDTSITLPSPWETSSESGGSGESAFSAHSHDLSGKHDVTIHNALKVNDYVIMIRQQGGQRYIVLDKVG